MSRGKITSVPFAGKESMAGWVAGKMAGEAKERDGGPRFSREWLACPPDLRYM
jgi:hypothetical protein